MSVSAISLSDKALRVHRRLASEYDAPIPFFSQKDPVSQLVSAMLSHRTRNQDTSQATKQLCEHFPTWQAVIDAPTEEVKEAIAAVNWPEQKAPRIQQALRLIAERHHGELSLDFLADMEPTAAQAWLEEIPGVGPKTSAAVLLFSNLRMPALPVDSHHHRVAQRLGLIPEKLGPGPAHKVLRAQLPAGWDAQQLYDNHEIMMFHGQRVCHYRDPACDDCVILDLCPTGQMNINIEIDELG